ncbi:MAG TPA: peptide-methionine (S)-S-oxide reductase [Spirochaetia bacterium]|nr:peptide-methionine (S)-S-oxide reductase [Spirochaetia bacterium]
MSELRQPGRVFFGGGCFWCMEAVFQRVGGVQRVVSGYAGGSMKNPTYEQVSTGITGHAEVVRVEYDPEVVDFDRLLEIFFAAHDPTTLHRQGADVGPQYRSIILYENEIQAARARDAARRAEERYGKPVVTEIHPLDEFYEAEPYHQDYFRKHPANGYCSFVIRPKLKKLGMENEAAL